MRTMITIWIIAAFLAVLAIASGCEDSPITAAKDDSMYLVALPSTVHVNPEAPTDPMPSSIVATVVSAAGTPKSGLLVFFSSDGGTMASGSQPVATDSNGNAYDTLLVEPGGPGTIVVTGTSTSLSQTATVTNGACVANTAPVAAFPQPDTPPAGAAGTTVAVNVNGSTSSDTAPGHIVSYEWTCGNGNTETGATAVCEYVIGTTSAPRTITLTVKDDGLGGTAPYDCQKTTSISRIVQINVTPASR
jgi:hypothetical protein